MENISICKKYKKRFAEISSSQALEDEETSGTFSGGPIFGDLILLVFVGPAQLLQVHGEILAGPDW